MLLAGPPPPTPHPPQVIARDPTGDAFFETDGQSGQKVSLVARTLRGRCAQHLHRIRGCCVHLPREERITRDVTFGLLCKR
jgi:hypothetical protein